MTAAGILKIFYDEEKDRLTVVERTESGEVLGSHHRAEHSFFLAAEDATPDVVKLLADSRHLQKIKPEGKWVRVIWDSRDRCEAVAEYLMPKQGEFDEGDEEGIATYDVAIPPWLRHALDRGLKFVSPRSCYLDFEWDSRVPFGKKHEARVLCWAVVDAVTRERFTGCLSEDTDDAERVLFGELLGVLDRYDQVAAWSGDRADFPVLRARVRRLSIPKDVRRWLLLDHLKLFKRANAHAAESGDEKQSFALDEVCRALRLPDAEKRFDASKSWEMWEAGGDSRRDLVEGCWYDTDRMFQVEERTGYLAMFADVAALTGVHHDSGGTNPNAQVESFLLRLAKEQDFRFQMKNPPKRYGDDSEADEDQENEKKFKGAEVIKPAEKGIIKDVHVVDFSRMYPSIILTWNMSPETIVPRPAPPPQPPLYLRHSKAWDDWEEACKRCDVVPPGVVVAPGTDRWFRTDKRGILCLAVEKLVTLRKQVSEKKAKLAPGTPEWTALDRLDQALKIVLNSFYGVVGSRAFRFCDRDVAEAVAQAGVWLIRRTIKEAIVRLNAKLTFSDTDSACLSQTSSEAVKGFTKVCNDELFPNWLETQGCYANGGIKIAYEKAFERIVFPLSSEGEPVAKRYAARLSHYKGMPATEETEPEIKGLEYKRGDSSKLTRDFQRAVIDMLMRDRCEDPLEFRAAAELWRLKVLTGDLELRDFVLSQSLSKPLSQYARKAKKYGRKMGLVEVTAETTSTIQVKFAMTGELVRYKREDVHQDSEVPKKKRGELLLVDWNEGPAHVRVARLLAKRGQDVGEGTRVRYVIVDGRTSPKTVVPADDFNGTWDRESFWESQVWPATARVLRGAFPTSSWEWFDKAGPTRVSPGRRRVHGEESTPQLGLFGGAK